ncbi:MAG: hypothetical protein DVB22_001450, partial [Verrucomicrobia bacterium]
MRQASFGRGRWEACNETGLFWEGNGVKTGDADGGGGYKGGEMMGDDDIREGRVVGGAGVDLVPGLMVELV